MRRLAMLVTILVLVLPGCKHSADPLVEEIEALGGRCQLEHGGSGLPMVVDLGFTGADDSVLEIIGARKQIREIYLWNTDVTDAGLLQLTGFSQLETLDLSNTAVTDAAVAQLKTLGGLKKLNLKGTKVSAAGVRDLRKALPNAKIIR